MPIDYKKYPKNWNELREQVRKRAGNKCELCGVENYSVGARDKHNTWHDENSVASMNSDYGFSLFGDYPKIIKIVCTTMHLDHDIDNNDLTNLKFACQKCHLNYDQKQHLQNSAITRKTKKLERTGQLELI